MTRESLPLLNFRLIEAARADRVSVANDLLARGARPWELGACGNSALHEAAERAGEELCEMLLSAFDAWGHGVDFPNKHSETPLCVSAGRESPALARELLARGASTRWAGQAGWTPLHIACAYGSLACARLLLSQGANPNAGDRHGHQPLHLACSMHNGPIIQALLQAGADPNGLSNDRTSPLNGICDGGPTHLASLMLGAGARADLFDAKGMSPLHFAALHGNGSLCALLMERGADPLRRNARGESAWDLAGQAYRPHAAHAILSRQESLSLSQTLPQGTARDRDRL